MLVWVVTSGTYSDYHIEQIFTVKENAERYARLNSDRCIEEYETDNVRFQGPLKMRVVYNIRNDEIVEVKSGHVYDRVTNPENRCSERGFDRVFVCYCAASEMTRRDVEKNGTKSERLLKFVRDKWNQYRAEHEIEGMEEEEKNEEEPVLLAPEDAAKMFMVAAALHNKVREDAEKHSGQDPD